MTVDLGKGIIENFDPELKRAFEFADQKVDPKLIDYSRIKMHRDSIKLSGDGAFYTIQGEGPTMGFPAVFIRLHVCNLKCTWCDAWYTWNPNTEEFWTEPREVSFKECASLIRQTWGASPDSNAHKRVVFTGGEPLIQRKQLDSVALHLGGEWDIEIETNGTLMPTLTQLLYWQFNCSPKLGNSDNRFNARVKPKILKALNGANTTFKFVVTSEKDLDEIEKDYLPHIDFDKVIIMPQGVTDEEVNMNAQKVAEYCKTKGFRLLGRLQNQLWDGARRRV